MRIDFFAREPHHKEHAMAIWDKLPQKHKGEFFEFLPNKSDNFIAVFCYGDQKIASLYRDKIIYSDHGVGLSYNILHPSYAGVPRENVVLRLCPNQHVYDLDSPFMDCAIVGVPKMDRYAKKKFPVRKEKPTIAVSFHWSSGILPELKGGGDHYYWENLIGLSQKYRVLGHGHPRTFHHLRAKYHQYGIEHIDDFNEVIERSDVYCVDNSSTLFEFAFTDKPVVVLNLPWYRRDVEQNFRFWKHASVGVQCNESGDLIRSVEEALRDSPEQKKLRRDAVKEIFHYTDGKCAKRAVEVILTKIS